MEQTVASANRGTTNWKNRVEDSQFGLWVEDWCFVNSTLSAHHTFPCKHIASIQPSWPMGMEHKLQRPMGRLQYNGWSWGFPIWPLSRRLVFCELNAIYPQPFSLKGNIPCHDSTNENWANSGISQWGNNRLKEQSWGFLIWPLSRAWCFVVSTLSAHHTIPCNRLDLAISTNGNGANSGIIQ